MSKIKEFVTYWGPSVADWSDTEKRFVIERDETMLNDAAAGGRSRPWLRLPPRLVCSRPGR